MSTAPGTEGYVPIDAVDTAYDPETLGEALHTLDTTMREYDWQRGRMPADGLDAADDWTTFLADTYRAIPPADTPLPAIVRNDDGPRELMVGGSWDGRESVTTCLLVHDTADGYRAALGTDQGWTVETDSRLVSYQHPVAGNVAFEIAPWDDHPITGAAGIPRWNAPPAAQRRRELEKSMGWSEDRIDGYLEQKDFPADEDRDRMEEVRDSLLTDMATGRMMAGGNPASLRYLSGTDVDPDTVGDDISAFARGFEELVIAGKQLDG